MSDKELIDNFIKMVKADLPFIRVEDDADFARHGYNLRFKCEITGEARAFTVDTSFIDTLGLAKRWERVREEILIARGLAYGKAYRSPSRISGGFDYSSVTTYATEAPKWTTSSPFSGGVTTSMSPTTTTAVSSKKILSMSLDELLADYDKRAEKKAEPKPKKTKPKEDYSKVDDFGIF